ncbi:MAG: hypothetical protein JW878_05950 [Methanomicrobia archaeon]|nr:hypothetical protein [Methanomicrobia archaeon]
MKINYRHILALLLISACCLMPLCMVGICAADESTLLPESPFQKVEVMDIRYDEVYETGLAEGSSEVSIKVVFTNVSKELDESTLTFYSDLEGAVGSISGEGLEDKALQSGRSYTLKHKKVVDDVVISWSGKAPEVGTRNAYTFLTILQATTEGNYSVISIEREVSSKTIEDAIVKIDNANKEIAKANVAITDAAERGLDVEEAETSLELADKHLKDANQFYGEGKPEEALEEAEAAITSAQDAAAKAGSAVGSRTYRNYGIIIVVVVVVVVVVVLFLQQMKRKRGVY